MTTLSRLKNLELRMAATTAEIDAAQALRYRVFYCEMGARGSLETHLAERDVDRFDAHADHLVVVDLALEAAGSPAVVGCYRLLREQAAARAGGFYTAQEFDLSGLEPGGPILELGRSCIAPAYRSGTVMQLLWRGISDYLEQHDIALMLGCASLPGTDPQALALPLAYLHGNHLAPPALRPRALPGRYVATDRLDAAAIDSKEAIRALPPLLKGYLRLGGMIGDGAVIDADFNTVDVCLVLPTERVQTRYQRHYAQARAAALEPA
ncbi:MAG: GNAT family N-acyltransferase [Geminicoccaceae bacterium]